MFNGVMCGRFVSFTIGEGLTSALATVPGLPAPAIDLTDISKPNWNTAPTQQIAVVTVGEGLQEELYAEQTIVRPMRWGLVPSWSKSLPKTPMFNARGETAPEKPSFRAAFKRRRCLVPMDGWYEWKPGGKNGAAEGKVPYFTHHPDGALFAAGLWEVLSEPKSGTDLLSCTIITTESVGQLTWLHDRMPRILLADEAERWLSAEPQDARELLHPTDEEFVAQFQVQEVSRRVGNARVNDPELIAPVGEQDTLL